MWVAVIIACYVAAAPGDCTKYIVYDIRSEQECKDFLAGSQQDFGSEYVFSGKCHRQGGMIDETAYRRRQA